MKTKFWQTREFEKLKDEWYAKLKSSGFHDAEDEIKGKSYLRQSALNCYRGNNLTEIESKQRYYELLGQKFYEEQDFRDEIEEFVMEKRVSGVKSVSISRTLERIGERCHKDTVRKIIRKYEKRWQIIKTK